MRVLIAALLALLPLAASAAEKKNCPDGRPVFVEPEGRFSGGSELRFSPKDYELAAAPHNEGTMTLTIRGKTEKYYLTSNNGPVRTYVVNLEKEQVSDEISFFDRSLNESDEDSAAMIYMSWLQVKRRKLLPGSEHIGRIWHFKKCEPAGQSPK